MRPFRRQSRPIAGGPRVGLARALSKLGFCSRAQAWRLIKNGRVCVNGVVARDPEQPVDPKRDRFEVDGARVQAATELYLMLNKPRGLVTTASDEQGRDTVFACLSGKGLPHLSPVGRLDKASEGLLLFTNDTAWAAHVSDPAAGIHKTYHVQIDCVADALLARRLVEGVTDAGEVLAARNASVLRQGGKNSWLEIVLDEGRNRHIRRLLAACGINVLRLVRVAVGPLVLGDLAKGAFRFLTAAEVRQLRGN